MQTSLKPALAMIIVAIALAYIRLTVHQPGIDPKDIFKDVSHIFMGILIPLAYQKQPYCRTVFWALCAVELLAALVIKP